MKTKGGVGCLNRRGANSRRAARRKPAVFSEVATQITRRADAATLAGTSWRSQSIWHIVAALCLCLFAETDLSAQSTRFTFEPAATMPTLADNRPALTEWVAAVHGPGLLEGRLELIVHANSQNLTTLLTDELVFTGLDQKVRVLLPPLNWPVGTDELLVDLRLHTKAGVIRLPQQRLRTLTSTSRKFPMLIGETAVKPRTSMGRDRLVDRLRFETIFPEELKDRALTVMSHLPVAELPQDPLSYCHYDVVVIADDVFAGLRPAQLEALLSWVRAGGSLYLEPAGILENSHLDFLNRLAEDDPRKLVFALDDKGRLPQDVYFSSDEFVHFTAGLGTAVVGLPSDVTAVADQDWRSAHATLWKLRDDQRKQIAASGTMNWPSEAQLGPQQTAWGAWQAQPMATLSNPLMTDVVQSMVDWLRPKGVRMVPLWVVASLLTSLIVLIGPVDYFLLTWLKRRKWTWITFPAAVVAMTALTMWITNLYLSSAESRKALVVHDVGQRGEILRSNRFELVFTASSRRLITDVHGALFTPLLTGGMTDPRYQGLQTGQQVVTVPGPNGQLIRRVVNVSNSYGIDLTSADPAVFQGRAPSRYRAVQQLRQWTPQLNRIMTIGQPADVPAINWDALQIPVVPNEEALRNQPHQQLLSRIRGQFGPSANFAVFSSRTTLHYDELVYCSDHQLSFHGDPYQTYSNYNQWQFQQYHQSYAPATYSTETMRAIIRLTSVSPQGLALLTSRTSPHGGRVLDDLPLHVSGAGDRWWLAIVVPLGDDLVVYRKTYAYSR